MSEQDKEATAAVNPVMPESNTASTSEPDPIFPKIKRQVFDVLYDDTRSEVWIGMKLRQTMKGQKVYPDGQRGPVEDVEVNIDGVGIIVCLDAAKQEVILALGRDQQALNEKKQRREMLNGNGLMGRLNAGLGKAFAAGKSLLS